MEVRRKIILPVYGVIFLGIGIFLGFFLPKILGDVLYPLEYKTEILKYSQQFAVPRNVVTALIFTESGFTPQAESGVGARGLMQIMPGTGSSIAKMLGETGYTADKLWDPDTNIRYGTAYIRSLYDTYGQNWDYAYAAYNGGGGAAETLIKTGNKDLIPRETNGFIRKVGNMRDSYDKLYGPEWEFQNRTLLTIQPVNKIVADLTSNLTDQIRKIITGGQ